MEVAAESALLNPSTFFPRSSPSFLAASHPQIRLPTKNFPSNLLFSSRIPTNCIVQYARNDLFSSRFQQNRSFVCRFQQSEVHGVEDSITSLKLGFFVNRRIIVLAATVIGVLVFGCRRVFAVEEVVDSGYGVIGQNILLLKSYWPKLSQVLRVFKEQGLVLAALLGLSAFFSMAETSITTLWPWKVRELAEKESEDGVFKMLSIDVTRFLTTILIGTTVVNIGATALVTKAATTIFGEVGVSAATGVMTVAVLLLTEITPKSIAVHNATEVARFVVRPVAWLSLILYPVGRVVTYLSMGMLKMLGLKGRSEPYVTEDELKLMLRGAELSGTIEEEEQDMIENVLEIKDTHVREVMTPLVDVVAIDASATLVDFHHLWVTHQYSRVPVFEQRVDNIVGIAYAMDLLDSVQKLYSKKRNRLEQRLNDLVFVKYNRTLRFRYDMRNTLDPISLQNIDESNEWLLGRMDGESDEDNEPVFDDDDGLTWTTVARASGVEESSHASRATSSRSKAQPMISKSSTLTPLQLRGEEVKRKRAQMTQRRKMLRDINQLMEKKMLPLMLRMMID
ncbi:putative DUF21 domain-containing protein At3g13070, chloroplastic isoform X4 [Camellia sinensis]|uniref:putative DUF21 domain-containing protein At3g13070, chloroplastic isoform X4 n=1 Tax=Camellia sinensis TaxID=4442 RepID=UPI001035EA34|nr:putative DUF21 domain-containing protein At3g13070, chloroplastic isoform X4 [Camellia sinensis]